MTRSNNGGKRAQEKRAAETIKDLFGDVGCEIAIFERELDQLIAKGRVPRVLSANTERANVFDLWQGTRDLKEAPRAFVEACQLYYDQLRRTAPAVLALKEELVERFAAADAEELVRQRSQVQRLMRRLRDALGDVPAEKMKAVQRILVEEIGSAGRAMAS